MFLKRLPVITFQEWHKGRGGSALQVVTTNDVIKNSEILKSDYPMLFIFITMTSSRLMTMLKSLTSPLLVCKKSHKMCNKINLRCFFTFLNQKKYFRCFRSTPSKPDHGFSTNYLFIHFCATLYVYENIALENKTYKNKFPINLRVNGVWMGFLSFINSLECTFQTKDERAGRKQIIVLK